MKIFKNIGIIILFLIIQHNAFSQEYSKNSLKYGLGVGAFDGIRTTGHGCLFSVGYERNLWKDRLRINPNLTFAYYNARFVSDVPDQWANSLNFETILFFDLVRIKAFSITIGAGGVINNTRGYIGTGGWPNNTNTRYISDYNIAAYLGGGIRINPKNSRIAIELMPLNFHVGSNYFMQAYAKFGIAVKLK